MNEVVIFNNPEFGKVRTVMDENNEPWFCLPDICRAIGLTDVNKVKKRLDQDGIQLVDLQGGYSIPGMNESNSFATFVNESNMYLCILRSDKPDAVKFRKWVTSEVLPEIRRTGKYELKNNQYELPSIPKTYPEALRTLSEQLVIIAEREEENAKLLEENNTMKPKVAIYEEVMSTEGLTGIRDTAFKLGFKQNEFVSMLINAGILYRTSRNALRPYSKFYGYFKLVQLKSKNSLPYNRLMVTNRGTEFLIARFKLKDIIPLLIDENEPDMGIEVLE